MTILKWTFDPPQTMKAREYISIIRRLEGMRHEVIPAGQEIDITPPRGFDGTQTLRTFVSKREDEGVVGNVTVEYRGKTPMFIADLASEVLEHKMPGRVVKAINRERIYYYCGVKQEGRIQISSIIGYRAESNERTKRPRRRRR